MSFTQLGAGIRRISMETTDALLEAMAARSRAATRAEKGRILAEIYRINARMLNGSCGAIMSWTDRDPALDESAGTVRICHLTNDSQIGKRSDRSQRSNSVLDR